MPARTDVIQRHGAAAPAPPALPPGDAFGLNQQFQTLQGQRSDILGTLAAQRAEIRAAFMNQRSAIQRQEATGVADVESASIGRGVLGSSVDFKGRINVRANASSALADALSARNQALLANRAAQMQANRDFEMGVANIQAQRAALQATQATSEFLAGLGGGGLGGGQGADVSRKEKKQLRALGHDIRDAALAYVRANGSARDDFYDTLMDAWRRRNRMRARFGLSPISRQRLNAYLQDLEEQYDTPGGLA